MACLIEMHNKHCLAFPVITSGTCERGAVCVGNKIAHERGLALSISWTPFAREATQRFLVTCTNLKKRIMFQIHSVVHYAAVGIWPSDIENKCGEKRNHQSFKVALLNWLLKVTYFYHHNQNLFHQVTACALSLVELAWWSVHCTAFFMSSGFQMFFKGVDTLS